MLLGQVSRGKCTGADSCPVCVIEVYRCVTELLSVVCLSQHISKHGQELQEKDFP